jgi:hypothetical protein
MEVGYRGDPIAHGGELGELAIEQDRDELVVLEPSGGELGQQELTVSTCTKDSAA